MTTKSDLELICNYVENSKPSLPKGVMYYMENVTSDDSLYLLELKRKNRDLAIDAILEDKTEEYLKNKSERDLQRQQPWPPEEHSMGTITPTIKSINMTAISYLDMDDIWNSTINKLEVLTSIPMSTSPGNQRITNISITNDINFTSSENFDINSRRIVTRLTLLSNMIASESYIGPAKTIICGVDVAEYITSNPNYMISRIGRLNGIINGLNVIISPTIKSNKIIVIRSSSKSESGLNVVNNINDLTYFLGETPSSWQRCIKWFEVI